MTRALAPALALALTACGAPATVTPPPETNANTGAEEVATLPGREPTPSERRAIATLERSAERVRGLTFTSHVPVRVQTPAEITAFIQDAIEQDELERARRFYVALGMLPPDLDVGTLIVGVMGEQVVGYYDPERDLMVIRDDVMRELGRSGVDPESASVLVHEYVHALQDQQLGLSAAMEVERTIDGENAMSSVVEGDATLSMIGYMADSAGAPLSALTSDPSRLRALLDMGMASARGDALAAAPPIVRVPLLSHYFDGLLLCATIHGRAAWPGVDGLHRTLPTTTEQVLHPEKYVAGEVGEVIVLPPLPSVESAGFAVLDEDTLGELEMSIFLGRGTTDRDATAGAGWDGDRVRVYERGTESAAVWVSAWDTEADAIEVEAAIAATPRAGEHIRRSGRAILLTTGLDGALRTDVDATFDAWAATLAAP